MSASSAAVIERVKVREVGGIFHSRDELDAAANTLMLSGFDRADLDLTTRDETRAYRSKSRAKRPTTSGFAAGSSSANGWSRCRGRTGAVVPNTN
jgi:hypothetical protein